MKTTTYGIVCCSRSPIKMAAVAAAAATLGAPPDAIRGEEAASGVPNQPYGDPQTLLLGALNRAIAVAKANTGDYIVAIENGIAPRPLGFVDVAYVVVITPNGEVAVRRSRAVPVPYELVERSRSTGWTVTAGQLEAQRTPGCDHADPHVVWSNGATTRLAILTNAVREALHAAISDSGAS